MSSGLSTTKTLIREVLDSKTPFISALVVLSSVLLTIKAHDYIYDVFLANCIEKIISFFISCFMNLKN